MIVTYTAKTFTPESICGSREHLFYVLEGDDGTWAWCPQDDAWFVCGFASYKGAFEAAEQYYMEREGDQTPYV